MIIVETQIHGLGTLCRRVYQNRKKYKGEGAHWRDVTTKDKKEENFSDLKKDWKSLLSFRL